MLTFFVYSSLYNNLCIDDDCIYFYKTSQRNILYKIYANKNKTVVNNFKKEFCL